MIGRPQQPGSSPGPERAPGPSRRAVLTTAGVAVAGGAVLGAAPVAAADQGHAVGFGPSGTTTVEMRGRIAQTGSAGEAFTSFGYLTRATNTTPEDLFAGQPHNETTALLTAYATGDLAARILDQSVHALDVVGSLTVYQRSQPGASFADPSSFTVGTAVARFDLQLQDILAVIATGKGIPTLTGDMTQTVADRLAGGLAGRVFGQKGQRLRFFATGLGTLVDPVTLNADLEIAGSWSAE